jgi:hypothetical protein
VRAQDIRNRPRGKERESARARERESERARARSFIDNQGVTAGREKEGGRKGVRQVGREGGRRGERSCSWRESCTLTQGCCSHPQHPEFKIGNLTCMKKNIITGISQTTSFVTNILHHPLNGHLPPFPPFFPYPPRQRERASLWTLHSSANLYKRARKGDFSFQHK